MDTPIACLTVPLKRRMNTTKALLYLRSSQSFHSILVPQSNSAILCLCKHAPIVTATMRACATVHLDDNLSAFQNLKKNAVGEAIHTRSSSGRLQTNQGC
jgi:hypothetical protein